jgi:hypothetical protein
MKLKIYSEAPYDIMSSNSSKDRVISKTDRPIQKLARQSKNEIAVDTITCKACNKEFAMEAYYDHVYDSDDCYRAYLASEKKEMSKQ